MEYRKLIPQIYPESIEESAVYYDNCGADELFYYDAASFDEGAEADVKTIKTICRCTDLPLDVCAKVKRFEDIKKMIYAGAKRVVVRTQGFDNLDAVREAAGRFGAERIYLHLDAGKKETVLARAKEALAENCFGGIVLYKEEKVDETAKSLVGVTEDTPEEKPAADGAAAALDYEYLAIADYLAAELAVPVFFFTAAASAETIALTAKCTSAQGLILSGKGNMGAKGQDDPAETGSGMPAAAASGSKAPEPFDGLDIMEVKQALKAENIPVNTFESAISFDEFKLNSDDMIPVVTQDYKTGEVLMVAYMTKESFEKTIATGKMTYFSRSRQELWTKGETSGHYQYVKSLAIDCDKDTILAKVAQIGAACHTGNRTCFFTDLVKKEYQERNPLEVFEEVMATIEDRKAHPKEGSYTNYLFDKGIDKILKKVGEEATEIVIAAKNPDAEELKYEICDFLYHMMVLMADCNVSWKEITDELAERH